MSVIPKDRNLVAEDLYGLPDDGRIYELAAGRLLSEPLPGFDHGEVMSEVAQLLGSYVRSQELGIVVCGDTGFILSRNPDTVRGPDVAFIRRDRLPSARLRTYYPGAPDLAVEVLSPGDRPGAVAAKVADYLAAGTLAVWILDPEERTATIFTPGAPARSLREDEDIDGAGVIQGFRCRVSALFGP
jgi:Uma2 family endonuclease